MDFRQINKNLQKEFAVKKIEAEKRAAIEAETAAAEEAAAAAE